MISEEERVAECALNRIFGYDPMTAHGIVDTMGSAAAFFKLDAEGRRDMMGPFSRYRDIIKDNEMEKSAAELEKLGKSGCRFIAFHDDAYPEMLRECEDAPMGLYLKSNFRPEEIFGIRPQISIVGTRDISLYGKEWCKRIVNEMSVAEKPPLIVSGYAMGTDITAHLTAIECGLPTVAVLPTGIDTVYPLQHSRWVPTMTHTPGCAFVTDFPPDTSPMAATFLRRNRIIAGLSSATLLIESRRKGGGMISCRAAFNYNRAVYALPGRIDDERSQGCNQLIKEKIAEPVEDIEAFLKEVGVKPGTRRTEYSLESEIRNRLGGIMTCGDLKLAVLSAEFIRTHRGATAEDICKEYGHPYSRISYITGLLQSEGLIEIDLLQRCTIRYRH